MSSFIIKLKGKKEIKTPTNFDTSYKIKDGFFVLSQRKTQACFHKLELVVYMFPIKELEYFYNPDRVGVK